MWSGSFGNRSREPPRGTRRPSYLAARAAPDAARCYALAASQPSRCRRRRPGAFCPRALWPAPAPAASLPPRVPVAAVATTAEQSWHRRARRRRQADRALIALDAARRRLAAHHGGGGVARAAMPQRRAGGGDRDASFRDRLFAFLDAERRGDEGGDRGRAGRGGSRGRDPPARGASGRSTAAEARQPRQGDWRCGCGFFPNFAHRRACFSCGKQRSNPADGAATRGSGSLLGPVGAGGLRPQLSWGTTRAAATAGKDVAPSFRVPGASLAARANAAQPAGQRRAPALAAAASKCSADGRAAEKGSATTVAGAADTDDDGFQTVLPRGRSRKRAADGGGDVGGATDVDDADDVDAMGEDGGGTSRGAAADGAEGADGEGDGDLDDAPTPAQLRRRWQEEIAVVKRLGQQGLPSDHPAFEAACQARDSAERAWREAKDPPPLSVRLGRAQSKLDRAIALQADTGTAIQKLEAEYKAQLAILEQKMEEDRDRVRLRRQQLEEVQAEAGAGVGGGGSAHRAGADAARRVHSAMCNEMAPAVAALVEQVDSDSPAWQVLNGLLCQLATSQHVLQQAFEPSAAVRQQQQDQRQQHQRQQPRTFDIGDGQPQDQRADGEDSEWSESHDLRGQVGTGADDDGWGPWRCNDRDDELDQPMGSGEWWDEPHWRSRARWQPSGYGQWTRSSWADSWEEENQGDGDAEQGAAKHRRTQGPAPAPAKGGAEPAAASGAMASGEPEASAAAKLHLHNERVAATVSRAIELGIQPLSDQGEELQLLTPGQLDEWIAAKLPSG